MNDVQIQAGVMEGSGKIVTAKVVAEVVMDTHSVELWFIMTPAWTVRAIGGNSLHAVPAPNTSKKESVLACV